MIDFHSHILPGIDDGASTPEMSAAMLSESSRQGVRKIVATPHFYPDKDTPDRFLARREESVENLKKVYDQAESPIVYVGAEVAFFTGIGHSEMMTELCIAGTPYLLVEMPVTRWSDKIIREIISIKSNLSINPIIAHVERYIFAQKKGVLDFLLENGVLIQSNADFFCAFRSRRRAVRMLYDEKIHLIGSDCHNMTTRAPNMAKAYKHISSRFDPFCIDRVNSISETILQDAHPVFDAIMNVKLV